MNQAMVEQSRAEANNGIAKLRMRRPDEASVHFTNALDRADEIGDDRARRDELAGLASLFAMTGFADLALIAAQEAVDLDESLGLTLEAALDTLTLGNAHSAMENVGKAETCFRKALAAFISLKSFANAASATTNIAALVANRGQMDEAIELLETSLQYVKQEPFDETEIQTRFALMQALEIRTRDVEIALDNARELCSARLFGSIPPPQRQIALDFVNRVIERYLAAHPVGDMKTWKKRNFPKLEG
jgi:tetratricopeptide (TPR) repeat protein